MAPAAVTYAASKLKDSRTRLRVVTKATSLDLVAALFADEEA